MGLAARNKSLIELLDGCSVSGEQNGGETGPGNSLVEHVSTPTKGSQFDSSSSGRL